MDEEATEDTLTKDGWLKSGDIASVDGKEMFYIVDRKKVTMAVGLDSVPANVVRAGTHQGAWGTGGTG